MKKNLLLSLLCTYASSCGVLAADLLTPQESANLKAVTNFDTTSFDF